MIPAGPQRRIVLVTGLSGAGKTSILHTLEDLGYQTIDNLPLTLVDEIVARETRSLAIGVDARSRDFAACELIRLISALRRETTFRAELVFATASDNALLRRYTETRRRHPLAPTGRISDGITLEASLLGGLREAADLLVDTSDLPASALRAVIETRFGSDTGPVALTVSLVSFAFPAGLPREADLVFDARFLRNPHYIAELRGLTGLDPAIGDYVREDPDYLTFFNKLMELATLLLPRFVQEGKRYVTIAVGCTGGRHRSVCVIEDLASALARTGWQSTSRHRELARDVPARLPICDDTAIPLSRADPMPAPAGVSQSAREA